MQAAILTHHTKDQTQRHYMYKNKHYPTASYIITQLIKHYIPTNLKKNAQF